VVVVVAAVGAVENDKLVAGGAKAVVVVETRTITARVTSSMRLEIFWIVIIVFFSGWIGRSGVVSDYSKDLLSDSRFTGVTIVIRV